jgi:transcriptional regulator with XRE-family HTH domain
MVNRAEIKRRRKANNWSYADAAEAAGWGARHRATWQHVESGHNKNPKVSTMEGMALALGCTVSDLLAPPPRRAGKRKR